MKKLSFVLSLVLVLTGLVGMFAPVSAAEATYAPDTVALVNGVEVTEDTILDAILESPAGGTVDVVKDFTTFSLIFETYEGITSEWVINGNGFTVKSPLDARSKSNYLITINAERVTINDLTLDTLGSGINVKDGAQVILNDVNVYSGGTKAGINNTPEFEYTNVHKEDATLNSTAVNLSATTRSTVYINGGVYKAFGVSGMVLAVNRGNMVVTDGYFVGEDCSFVARVWNKDIISDMSNGTASLTVYGGTFIKPVVNRHSFYYTDSETKAESSCTDGCVVRGDAGGIVNIHGGTFANFTGKTTNNMGVAKGSQRDFVILGGISTSKPGCNGFINIFGGDFYSFMTKDCNGSSTQLIGNYSGSASAMNEAELGKIYANIYGGNFYSTIPTREDNILSVIDKAEKTIQRVPFDQYTTDTKANQTVTVYGQEFTGVTKWTVNYVEPTTAPAGAAVKVENASGNTYYLTDYIYSGKIGETDLAISIPAFAQAVNGVADDGAKVTLLSDIAIVPTEILCRGQELTIDGADHTITAATNGLTVSSGDITIKNLTITSEGSYAFKIAKSAIDADPESDGYNVTVDAFELDLVLENCKFNGGVIDNPFLKGSVATTGCKINGNDITIEHTYAAPTIEDVPGGDEPGGDEPSGDTPSGDTPSGDTPSGDTPSGDTPSGDTPSGDTPSGDTPSGDTPTGDAPATDNKPADDNKTEKKSGCGSAIGVGAIAILAVAGLACGVASKKRED
jgi:hypothetical protein